ncbi:hypothetical protein WISP_131246 [Willisornis vidua]|uniref:Uncharacterized protein n=1 Tax=Willisornis vidua TaxID=1566151 RepID=A0ABQ9CUL6_9PASS|nr:hypothetical protein WISP_131246 [Willisornis vidua]
MITGLQHLSCEDGLELFNLEKRRLWGDLVASFQYLKEVYKRAGVGLFTSGCSDGTRENVFGLKDSRFSLDIRKKLFIVRMVRHWNRLPREAVDGPSLEVLKARVDGTFGSLVLWKVFLPVVGRLEVDHL